MTCVFEEHVVCRVMGKRFRQTLGVMAMDVLEGEEGDL